MRRSTKSALSNELDCGLASLWPAIYCLTKDTHMLPSSCVLPASAQGHQSCTQVDLESIFVEDIAYLSNFEKDCVPICTCMLASWWSMWISIISHYCELELFPICWHVVSCGSAQPNKAHSDSLCIHPHALVHKGTLEPRGMSLHLL